MRYIDSGATRKYITRHRLDGMEDEYDAYERGPGERYDERYSESFARVFERKLEKEKAKNNSLKLKQERKRAKIDRSW